MRIPTPLRLLLLFTWGAALACDPGPTTTEETDPTQIFITGFPVVSLSPGDSMRLAIEARDAAGRSMEVESIRWESSDSRRAAVDGAGLLVGGSHPGQAWVYAQVGELRDSVSVWIQRDAADPSRFSMTLHFTPEVPERWRAALQTAADRWEQVIRDTLPGVVPSSLHQHCSYEELQGALVEGVERGTRILVLVSHLYPRYLTVSATGGVCMNRGLPHPTTVVGVVSLNGHRMNLDRTDARYRYVAHHELGHALGLVGLIQGAPPPWIGPRRDEYRGHLGLYGHFLDTGIRVQSLIFNWDSAHWASLMDVMGGGGDRINHISVGALMDMGYPAAWYGAGETAPMPWN